MRSDDEKFDARIELGSPADKHIRKAASEVVQTYLEHVVLKQRLHNPYVVGEVMVDPTTAVPFTNSLHGSYSGLNKTLELPFAEEPDKGRRDSGAAIRRAAALESRCCHRVRATSSTPTSWRGRERTSLRWTPKASISLRASRAASSSPSGRTLRRRRSSSSDSSPRATGITIPGGCLLTASPYGRSGTLTHSSQFTAAPWPKR